MSVSLLTSCEGDPIRRVTRRQFLKEGAAVAGGAALASLTLASACRSAETTVPPKSSSPSPDTATRPTVSPAGYAICYDDNPYPYIVTPGGIAKIPTDRKYSPDHVWVKEGSNQRVTIGITERFVLLLSGITKLELIEAGLETSRNTLLGGIGGTKMIADLVSPLSGRVIKTNSDKTSVEVYPYTEGWLAELELSAPREMDGLLSPDEYAAYTSVAIAGGH